MNIADLNAEARLLCDADATSYSAADLLRRINVAYEQCIGWIINADGTWQFDDTNYTDTPRGKGTLKEGEESYSYASKYLQIEEVAILDLNKVYRKIKSFDPSEFNDITWDEHFGVDASGNPTKGFPEYYDPFTDDSFRLGPAPAAAQCTLASGYRVKFKRTASVFTSAEVTTGTKEPGFASPFHIILAYMSALPYCASYHKDRIALYEKKMMDLKAELLKHYARREKDHRNIFKPLITPFR